MPARRGSALTRDGRAARHRLPAPTVATAADGPVRLHDDVAHLRCESVGAPVERTPEDQAAADPGADPDVEHMRDPAGRPDPVLAVGTGRAVVLDDPPRPG